MEAADAIAKVFRCDERTIRNIISDSQKLVPLPANVIQAAHSAGIDLARKRHAPFVRTIEAKLAAVENNPGDGLAMEIVRDAAQISSSTSSTNDLFEKLTRDEKAHLKSV